MQELKNIISTPSKIPSSELKKTTVLHLKGTNEVVEANLVAQQQQQLQPGNSIIGVLLQQRLPAAWCLSSC